MAYRARFTEQIALRMAPAMKARLIEAADRREVSTGTVMREALEFGLEYLEDQDEAERANRAFE